MIRIVVKLFEVKMVFGFWWVKIFLIFIFFLMGEKLLEILIIGVFGSMDVKLVWCSLVGELELLFFVIMMIDWVFVLIKVWAVRILLV